MSTHAHITVTLDPAEVKVRRIPSALGDFSVLDLGDVSVYVVTRADLDALQAALDTIRAAMDVADMAPGELVEVWGK
jgi:hypothetical protein